VTAEQSKNSRERKNNNNNISWEGNMTYTQNGDRTTNNQTTKMAGINNDNENECHFEGYLCAS